MYHRLFAAAIAVAWMTLPAPSFAWSENGHQTVGAIADGMIKGTRAEKEVTAILGTYDDAPLTLSQVSVWADCARSVKPIGGFPYVRTNQTPQACSIFEDDAGEAALSDYAARNNDNCTYKDQKKSCHEAFHFADIDVMHDHYSRQYQGANDHDVVQAINAAIAVLQDKDVPAPFDIASKKEALMLLVHFTGDIHQPLHVGAVYLDTGDGSRVHPTPANYEKATDTAGGNFIQATGGELHGQWDHTNFDFSDDDTITSLVSSAKQLDTPQAEFHQWAQIWASDTIVVAQTKALVGLNFSGQITPPSKPNQRAKHKVWPATFDDRKSYLSQMKDVQQQQVIKGGAHLAQLLQAIWPN